MKSKTFLILLVAASILAALSFFRFGGEGQNSGKQMGKKLLSDFPVNEVAKVEIFESENQVTLVKGETVWQVEERAGYPADFNDLRELVVKLSKLKIGRTFPGTAESIDRLSLSSPKTDDAKGKGKQITLRDASGKMLADLIIGETRKAESGANGGQYLRKNEAKDVFLVDDGFPFLKTSPSQWLRKEVLNIKADEIVSVACYLEKSKSPLYTLSRPQKGETAQLTPLPSEREVNTAKIDQVFDTLAPLSIDDVKAVSQAEEDDPSNRTRLVYRLYDGREITVFPETSDEETYTVQLTARDVEPTLAKEQEKSSNEAPERTDTSETEVAGEKTEEKSPPPSSDKKPESKTAQSIDAEVRPWIFTIKKWQFDSLITEPELLLEEVKKEGETS